jgi:hypothetical protein|tara:strand:- start:955 stop:1134 length:180 start_codon:yes stop_codon:yes gene_type:complete
MRNIVVDFDRRDWRRAVAVARVFVEPYVEWFYEPPVKATEWAETLSHDHWIFGYLIADC